MYNRTILEGLIKATKPSITDISKVVNNHLSGREIIVDQLVDFLESISQYFNIKVNVEIKQKQEYRFEPDDKVGQNRRIEPVNYLDIWIDNGLIQYQETENGLRMI